MMIIEYKSTRSTDSVWWLVTHLEYPINLGQVESLLVVQFVDVVLFIVHQKQGKPHDLDSKRTSTFEIKNQVKRQIAKYC